MKISELIEQLQSFPGDMDVYIMSFDGTADDDGRMLDADAFERHHVYSVHDGFCDEDIAFVSIECARNITV